MKKYLGKLLTKEASTTASLLTSISRKGKPDADVACFRVMRVTYFIAAVAIFSLICFSVDLYAEQPKKTKVNPAKTAEKETKTPQDSRLSDPSWNIGVSAKGCYWVCTAPNGCTLDRAMATSDQPSVMGISGGGRGDLFFEKTRLISAPPGSLREANGWVRQCDKETSQGNDAGSATDKDHH